MTPHRLHIITLTITLIFSGAVYAEKTIIPAAGSTDNSHSLVFLAAPPAQKPYTYRDQITISHSSMDHGWVSANLCYENIPAITSLQIPYNKDTTRRLTLASSANIGKASVDNNKVELRQVKDGAKICVQYETKAALTIDKEGVVRLNTGPYVQQSPDGFLPVKVILNISYPCEDLYFLHSNHTNRIGYTVNAADCEVHIDTLFKGKLASQLMFVQKHGESPK